MKKAFTLLELILVVIVVGILSVAIVPRLHDNALRKAAEQIIFHLNYTRHLAMMDNRFSSDDTMWYKTRWQLLFSNCRGDKDTCAYSVFSDWTGHHTGNPDAQELAVNPLNRNQRLSGGMSGNLLIKYNQKEATKSLNIGQKYQINKVKMLHCGSSARRVAFDYLGRPVMGNLATMSRPYRQGRLLQNRCEMTLINRDGEQITILIEPETGYIHLKE